jgi:LemA protein
MIGLWVFLAIVAILVFWMIGMYNRLVVLRNRIENAWSQIDVQLKRRVDLIPNLVETVKGYAKHEKETFERVIQARAALVNAGGNVKAQAEADNMLTGAQGEPELHYAPGGADRHRGEDRLLPPVLQRLGHGVRQ